MEESLNESVPLETLIKYLVQERKELQTELGKERAYIFELEEKLNSLQSKLNRLSCDFEHYKKSHKKFYDEISKDEGVQEIKFEYDFKKAKLNNEVKRWQAQRDSLLATLKKYSDLLNYYELL